jgi:hypothetical protein
MFMQLEKVMKGMLRVHSLREVRETAAPKSIAAAIVAMMTLKKKFARKLIAASAAAAALVALAPQQALAVPSFARQTGQNCVACHAGGQFPELTPYGRLFKLTGYTIGERALPLAMMAVVTANKQKVNDPTQGKTQDGSLIFNTASLFIAGKISDRVGGFAQITYNNYDNQNNPDGTWAGHSGSDNLDIRYADHLIDNNRDLIYGFTLHNNPGVQDVFNSAPAWGYGVVPGSTGQGSGTSTILEDGLGQQVAGIGAYAYWNKTLYAELTGYRNGDGVFSFMTQGNGGQVYIKGTNPYVRLALTKEWGPHNVMVGLTHFDVHPYTDQTNLSGATDHYRDTGIDAQYQYLLDPYTLTAMVTRIHETIDPDASTGVPSDTVDSLRAKASFTYQAKYGATLSYFNYSNTGNSASAFSAVDARYGSRGWTPEVFWTPVQYVRLGLQYTTFNRFNDTSDNAKDNNTLFFYIWGAY